MNHTLTHEESTRIRELENHILIYEQRKAALVVFAYNLNKKYLSKEISFEEYIRILRDELHGRTLEVLLKTYDALIYRYTREKEKLLSSKTKPRIVLAFAILFIIVLSVCAFYYGPGITGYTVFAQEKSSRDLISMHFNASGYYLWNLKHPQEFNSLMIAGRIMGVGTTKVYLVEAERRYLIYSKDSRTSETDFKDGCQETCMFPQHNMASYNLYAELNNTELVIESIGYFMLETYDIDAYPRKNSVVFEPNVEKKFILTVLNKEKKNFDAFLYITGNLSSYITLSDSLIHFAGEREKNITYELSLPSNYSEGIFSGEIIVRYLPKGKFKGEAPYTTHILELIVPYNETYASAQLEHFLNDKNEVQFMIPVLNRGNKEFLAHSWIEIYRNDLLVDTIKTNQAIIYPGEQENLHADWKYKFGRYHAIAHVLYGEKVIKLEKDISIGKESVSIYDVAVGYTSLPEGEVSIDIWLRNELSESINNSYIEISVFDAYNSFISKTLSDIVSLAPGEEAKVTASLNPREFAAGDYTFRILMHYGNTFSEKVIKARITKDSITLLNDTFSKPDYELYLVILSGILILFNLTWLFFYLKRKK
jgi:hypothetical protein